MCRLEQASNLLGSLGHWQLETPGKQAPYSCRAAAHYCCQAHTRPSPRTVCVFAGCAQRCWPAAALLVWQCCGAGSLPGHVRCEEGPASIKILVSLRSQLSSEPVQGEHCGARSWTRLRKCIGFTEPLFVIHPVHTLQSAPAYTSCISVPSCQLCACNSSRGCSS